MKNNPFPDLPPDEYDALLEDIEKRGMVYPVIRDQHGRTIDGHQRERACAALGIVPHYRVVPVASDTEREALAIVLNTHRRHLTPAQRGEAILRLAATGMTQAEIGAAVGVSQGEVSKTVGEAREVGDIPRNNPPDEPLTDKQGRPPEKRGGRPRASAPRSAPRSVPGPIQPSIHVVMKAFRRDLTRLLVAYEEVAGEDEFAGEFGAVIEAIRRALQE